MEAMDDETILCGLIGGPHLFANDLLLLIATVCLLLLLLMDCGPAQVVMRYLRDALVLLSRE